MSVTVSVDLCDMLKNFCFHVYAQKSLFIGLYVEMVQNHVKSNQARKTFKIAWDPEFPRKIAFEIFFIKNHPYHLNQSISMQKRAKYFVFAQFRMSNAFLQDSK